MTAVKNLLETTPAHPSPPPPSCLDGVKPDRLLGLPEALRLATLPRNITSPLAMAICSMLGADASLAIAIVVITGVIGANFGAVALDALG